MKLERTQRDALVRHAERAKLRAYAPYSRFRVGAALLMDDGSIIDGCNVENASYGLTICAERNAVFNAVFRGKKRLSAVAIASDDEGFLTPCGACRQVISEFADPSTKIILTTVSGKVKVLRFDKLFPTPPDLKKLSKRKK